MRGGLISTGLEHQRNALSGFVRQSAEQQKMDEAKKDRDAAETNAMISTGASAAGMIATLALSFLG